LIIIVVLMCDRIEVRFVSSRKIVNSCHVSGRLDSLQDKKRRLRALKCSRSGSGMPARDHKLELE
jgi:hypothetical protein